MITKKCGLCGIEFNINFTAQELRLYILGMPISDVMPDLTSAEKNLFLSGMCNACYNEICAEEESIEENVLDK